MKTLILSLAALACVAGAAGATDYRNRVTVQFQVAPSAYSYPAPVVAAPQLLTIPYPVAVQPVPATVTYGFAYPATQQLIAAPQLSVPVYGFGYQFTNPAVYVDRSNANVRVRRVFVHH